MKKHLAGAGIMAAALAAAAANAAGESGTVKAERPGATYYPGECAAFTVPTNAVRWQVRDMDDAVVGEGAADGAARLVLDEKAVGGRFGAFALDVSAADGATNRTWFARLTSREVKTCPWVGSGCHFATDPNRPLLADMVAAAGIGIVRASPGWSACERKRGEFAPPSGFDEFVDELLARGVRMNMGLWYGNGIYENGLDPEAFARFAAWAATHYKGRVDRFEIWNEPHNFSFKKAYWKEGESQLTWISKFIELTHKADDAIRAANPDAIVGVTGEDHPTYLWMMLENGIARAHNAVAFHPYCHRQHRPEREYFLSDFGASHRALARAHGGANRWTITEAGWTTYEGEGEFWQVAGFYPRASYAGQASCIVRMYLAALEAGCDYACQYDFRNDGLKKSYTEHNFGLVHADYTPKPSYAAVAFLTRHVGRRRYVGDLSAEKERYRVALFDPELGDRNGRVIVPWCIEGECEWEVPASYGRWVECRDLVGNAIEPPVVAGRRLKLTERPFYVKFETPPEH